MPANRINTEDELTVAIINNEGTTVYEYEGTGFHNVEHAIAAAFSAFRKVEMRLPEGYDTSLEEEPSFHHYYRNPAAPDNEIEDYVFKIYNDTQGTASSYRVNAGGHAKLIV